MELDDKTVPWNFWLKLGKDTNNILPFKMIHFSNAQNEEALNKILYLRNMIAGTDR
jgi:hypothetical protein